MKKHLRLLVLTLLCAVCGSAMAMERLEWGFVVKQNNKVTDYETLTQTEIGGHSWSVTGNMSIGDFIRIGGKSLDGVARVQQFNEDISGITRVQVNHNGRSKEGVVVNSVKLTVSDKADFSTVIDEVTVTNPNVESPGNISFSPSPSKSWTGYVYFKFTFIISTAGSKNMGLDVTSFNFYTEVNGAVYPEVSFKDESETIEKGQTVCNELTKPDDLNVVFSSNKPSIASVDQDGVVTGLAEGTATITASWDAVTDKYISGMVYYEVTVTRVFPLKYYGKVTDRSMLQTGNKFILVATTETSATVMGRANADGNKYRESVDVAVVGTKVATKENSGIVYLTLDGSHEAWALRASDTDEFIALTSDNNYLQSSTDASQRTSQWIITEDFQLESIAFQDRYIKYNSQSPRFACYKGNQVKAVLYMETKADPQISFSSTTAEGTVGESFDAPTFNNPNNLTVTFSSSDPAIAGVDEQGIVNLISAGETVITATFTGNDTYEAGTASYTLTVNEAYVPPQPTYQYMTYCSSNDLDFTEKELKAYIATGFTKGIVRLTRVTKIPANTGIIIKSDNEDLPAAFSVDEYVATDDVFAEYANMLVGVVSPTAINPTYTIEDEEYTTFVLSKPENMNLGFYILSSTGVLGANKAYLLLKSSVVSKMDGAANGISLEFVEDTDAIQGVETKTLKEDVWYTIQGVRVAQPTQSGIYIYNGTKVVVK